ncbi:MAG: hypothetical protein GY853_11300 [PVC group bacterium]|nr:hypothetical protein [PVC group bacterium]
MNGKIVLLILGVFAVMLVSCVVSFAAVSDANNVKEVYEGATVECATCHVPGNFKELNSYGEEYNDAGRNTTAVEISGDTDSDGDDVSNADEIMAGTNPGDAESK